MRYDETGKAVAINAGVRQGVDEPVGEHPDEETLAELLIFREAEKFMGALAAIGAGAVVIVNNDDDRAAWRKTFKQAEKGGVLKFHPLIRVDEAVPEGQIRIQDVDDRPDEATEAVATGETVSEGGVVLPMG